MDAAREIGFGVRDRELSSSTFALRKEVESFLIKVVQNPREILEKVYTFIHDFFVFCLDFNSISNLKFIPLILTFEKF